MKFISELACFIFILLAMSASSSVNAIPRTDVEALYSDSLYLGQGDAEVPTAFESSARLSEDGDSVEYFSSASEVVDLGSDPAFQPDHGKKLNARLSRKKSRRN